MVNVPLVVVASKSDIRVQEGYRSMSTETKEGVDGVLEEAPQLSPGMAGLTQSR